MKKCILICFLGIDGSGKSTLSRYLYSELKLKNYDVSYKWWLDGENSLLRNALRKISGLKQSTIIIDNISNNPKKNRGSMMSKTIRILYPSIVLIDYLWFGIINAWIPMILNKQKVIIFDRFIYDVLLSISNEFRLSDSSKESLFGTYSKFFPSLDLIFVVNVTPELSYSRKKEEIGSINNASIILERYKDIYDFINRKYLNDVAYIDNTRTVDISKKEILDKTMKFIENIYKN